MLHNEHFRKADELYECRHDDKGNGIHVFIKDGKAIVFPSLFHLFLGVCEGKEVERFYCSEELLSELYESESYNYYTLKESAMKIELPIETILTKDNSPELIAEYPILENRKIEYIRAASIRVEGLSFQIYLDHSEIEHIKNICLKP